MIDGTLNKICMVMGFETSDDALIIWLHMCCKVRLEILDVDALKSIRDNVTQEVVLEEKDFSAFL